MAHDVVTTVRLSQGLLDRIDEWCGREDRSRSWLIREAVESHLDGLGGGSIGARVVSEGPLEAKAKREAKVTPEGTGPELRTPADVAALQASCPHPKGEKRHHGWGSSCGLCGTRLP